MQREVVLFFLSTVGAFSINRWSSSCYPPLEREPGTRLWGLLYTEKRAFQQLQASPPRCCGATPPAPRTWPSSAAGQARRAPTAPARTGACPPGRRAATASSRAGGRAPAPRCDLGRGDLSVRDVTTPGGPSRDVSRTISMSKSSMSRVHSARGSFGSRSARNRTIERAYRLPRGGGGGECASATWRVACVRSTSRREQAGLSRDDPGMTTG